MKIDVIVPVYRNLELVRNCLSSLQCHLGEIADHEPRLIVIDDSPDDKDVSAYLRRAEKEGAIDVLVVNEVNLGFVKSVNKGLALARKRGAAAILVNSDTVTFRNTLKELVDVALLDEQYGFVCPRSNNASICTFPRVPHKRGGTTINPDECYSVWQDVHRFLPRTTLAPTAIGFYMLINPVVVANFGRLDERFGVGYEEENDLVMRAGKVGFRAVLANHSFAYHAGSASFLLSELDLGSQRETNLRAISDLHPEFLPLVRKYENSPSFRAERILSALVPDASGKIDVALNLFGLTPVFNGTNEFAVSIVRAIDQIGSKRFNFYAICNRAAAEFHGFDGLRNVRVRTSTADHYAIAFTFGQPYDLHDVNVMEGLAPVNVYSMLDTISLDCSGLRVEQNIEELWAHVARTSNGLLFISQFTRDTFLRRFNAKGAKFFSRLLPTKLSGYEDRYRAAPVSAQHVFVAGNHFPHKDSSRTAKFLAHRFPSLRFVTMGPADDYPQNALCLKSGTLDDAEMIETLAMSSVIVLPSFYEGFGFSLLHALALRKPVVARNIPVTREILEQFGSVSGVFLFSNEVELEEALRLAIDAGKSSVRDQRGDDWNSWSTEFLKFLEQLVEQDAPIHDTLVERITLGDQLRSIATSRAGHPQAFDLGQVTLQDLTDATTDAFIRMSYQHVLGREPDNEGFVHYRKMLSSGLQREALLRAFFESEEYKRSGRRVFIAGLDKAGRKASLLTKIFGR